MGNNKTPYRIIIGERFNEPMGNVRRALDMSKKEGPILGRFKGKGVFGFVQAKINEVKKRTIRK